MMDQRVSRPPPAIFAKINGNVWTAPFWAAAAAHSLVLPRCSSCSRFRMPPTPFCPYCRSQSIDWVTAPERAILYSYTIVDRSIMPGMEEDLPYVPAIIEFPDADGVRLISNIVGSPLDEIAVGAHVALFWRDIEKDVALPIFAIVSRSEVGQP